MQVIKQLELRKHLNQATPVFKLHLSYDEVDHVFNIAMNLLAGGTCLEHIELRRTDEALECVESTEDSRSDDGGRFLPTV